VLGFTPTLGQVRVATIVVFATNVVANVENVLDL
jgi:hypothetical protein